MNYFYRVRRLGSLALILSLLAGVLAGDATLSVRGDVAEECWRVVEPVLAAWRAGEVPLEEYPAGGDGPPPRDRPAGVGAVTLA